MAVIIDTNCFTLVFTNPKYISLKNWIVNWPWMIVLWWKCYYDELALSNKAILPLLKEFSKIWKVLKYDDAIIDSEQFKIETLETDPDFDDPHIIALAVISKVLIVATNDKRSMKFIKDRKFYSTSKLIPKIYSWTTKNPATILNISNIHSSNRWKCKILKNSEKPNI